MSRSIEHALIRSYVHARFRRYGNQIKALFYNSTYQQSKKYYIVFISFIVTKKNTRGIKSGCIIMLLIKFERNKIQIYIFFTREMLLEDAVKTSHHDKSQYMTKNKNIKITSYPRRGNSK